MLIPIADGSTGSGSGTRMHIVTWLAWQVWGGGSGPLNVSGGNNQGTNCYDAIRVKGGSMKYCGRLLGAVSITGGAGAGPGTAGQPHVLKLTQ